MAWHPSTLCIYGNRPFEPVLSRMTEDFRNAENANILLIFFHIIRQEMGQPRIVRRPYVIQFILNLQGKSDRLDTSTGALLHDMQMWDNPPFGACYIKNDYTDFIFTELKFWKQKISLCALDYSASNFCRRVHYNWVFQFINYLQLRRFLHKKVFSMCTVVCGENLQCTWYTFTSY